MKPHYRTALESAINRLSMETGGSYMGTVTVLKELLARLDRPVSICLDCLSVKMPTQGDDEFSHGSHGFCPECLEKRNTEAKKEFRKMWAENYIKHPTLQNGA